MFRATCTACVAASLSIDFSIALLSPSSVDAESWLSLLSIPSRERKTGECNAVAMYLESRSSQDCASSAALCVGSLTRVRNLRRCRTLSAGQMWKYRPRFSLSATGTRTIQSTSCLRASTGNSCNATRTGTEEDYSSFTICLKLSFTLERRRPALRTSPHLLHAL
jgi:hypothetical protein